MKGILKFILILCPFFIQAQGLVPYKKALPTISKKGIIALPNGSKEAIEGFNDKETVIIFMMRHAEKDTAGGSNADLNNIGRGRAKAVATIFKPIEISKIYSTDKPRTRNTAQPTANQKHKAVEIYDPKKHKEFLESVVNSEKGHNILIVGHSNTVPQMLNILRGGDSEKDIPDNEYSRMYIISIKKMGEVKVKVINF